MTKSVAFIKLADAASFYKKLPHQEEAWNWLQRQLSPDVLADFGVKYRIETPPKPTFDNTWDGVVAAAQSAGAKYPELVAAQWALESNWGKHPSGEYNYFGIKGTGSTRTTQEFIDNTWVTITDGFVNFPDLRSCITYLVDRWYKDYKTFKGVNNAANRNAAAVQLKEQGYATDPGYAIKLIQLLDSKLGTPGGTVIKVNPLPVLYMSQRDNYRDASRTCFSSSCAMMLKYLKPTSIKNDDDYLKVVFTYGDSTDSTAQLKALFKFGVEARFYSKGDVDTIKKQIDKNKPVPVGFLHQGPVTRPTGGGHWLCITGYDDTGWWVNDPWGEADLESGTYVNTNGKNLHYSYKNFNPRWLIEGLNSGWCMLA
jgi:uncharacterized protein YvpB